MALRLGLALVVVALVGAAPAAAATSLPDLAQQVPKQVQIGGGSGAWQIGFLSEVVNVGAGPLEIRGSGPGGGQNMTATQYLLTNGSMQAAGVVGDLHYETGFGHKHWHFEPFDHYELRSVAGALIGTDQKEGFCLGDNNRHGGGSAVYNDPSFCQQNNPDATSLTEGISPGWGDSYDPLKEGQDVPIKESTSPTGDYNLVHRVNENPDGSHGPVQESSWGNNVASAWIHLTWTNGKPSIGVVKTCTGTALCASPATTTTTTTSSSSPTTTTTTTTTQTTTSTTTTTTVSTTTTSGQTQTTQVATDSKAPKLVLHRGSVEHLRPGARSLFVYASCDERCMFSARGTVSLLGPAKSLRTGRTTVELLPGTVSKVRLRLSRSLRATIRHALAHHRRVQVKVTMTAIDSSGNVARGIRTLRILR